MILCSRHGFTCSLVIAFDDKYFNKPSSNWICFNWFSLLSSRRIFLKIYLLLLFGIPFALSIARYKLPWIPFPKCLIILYLGDILLLTILFILRTLFWSSFSPLL